jgi:hypothetical protein
LTTDVDQALSNIEELQPVDSLDSTSTTKPLSANQGKILKDITDEIRGHLLWSSSITSRGAETLNLADSDYDYAIIFCYRNGALNNKVLSYICEKRK